MMYGDSQEDTFSEFDIAIVGMSGRFPGAQNVDIFWNNLCEGRESVKFFSDDELNSSGVDEATYQKPNYVKAAPVLEDPAGFDTRFFGFTPKEARLMDPQHRLMLELAWEAMENAGYDCSRLDGRAGVFASCAMNTYFINSGVANSFGSNYLSTLIGNDKDFLATRISHRMGLTGPSITVQSACSSSLVAVHMAGQSLINRECDIALAGGAAVRVPLTAGYLHEEGSVFSKDGHCRPFDADASGTIFGSGGGMVVLKRLEDAIASNDIISAVVKGSAVNNDGDSKAEYTAPSVKSQSEVIAEAMTIADIDPADMRYVETHGTGTLLGDPIEVAALSRAYGKSTSKKSYCGIGSLKSNIGHLDAAAGVCSLIKTAIALREQKIPPSINYENPNPKIDFDNSPFYVNSSLMDWPSQETPTYAGVTSLGIGGTNAHVVLGAGPNQQKSAVKEEKWNLFPISAVTEDALQDNCQAIEKYLVESDQTDKEPVIHAVATTLQTGRRAFTHRKIVVAQNTKMLGEHILRSNGSHVRTGRVDGENHEVVMLFSGQGSQYINMSKSLYTDFDVFREIVDSGLQHLQTKFSLDLRSVLFPTDQENEQQPSLSETRLTQPAIFIVEYALSRLYNSWGIKADYLMGHSIGEYVAACIAGVFSFETGLELVTIRGKLMQQMPGGSMLGVSMPAKTLRDMLPADTEIACVNSTGLSVVSGTTESIERFATELADKDIDATLLKTSHAFHSSMMEPMLEEFHNAVLEASPRKPELPIISNVSGQLLTDDEATSPEYWVSQLRQPVQFADGLTTLLENESRVFLEIGPGRTLLTFAQQHDKNQGQLLIQTMPGPRDPLSDSAFALRGLGELWKLGVDVDWSALQDDKTQKTSMPGYQFQRQHIWAQTSAGESTGLINGAGVEQHNSGSNSAYPLSVIHSEKDSQADSLKFYFPSWKRSAPVEVSATTDELVEDENGNSHWLIFSNQDELSSSVNHQLTDLSGGNVTEVTAGHEYSFNSDSGNFQINPGKSEDYENLFQQLDALNKTPNRIMHLWCLGDINTDFSQAQNFEIYNTIGFKSICSIAKSVEKKLKPTGIKILVVTEHAQEVNGSETVDASRATLFGAVRVIPKEFPLIDCCTIDIEQTGSPEDLYTQAHKLIREFETSEFGGILAYRGKYRWCEDFESIDSFDKARGSSKMNSLLENDGVYVVFGGLGGIGQVVAKHLGEKYDARICVVGRTELPDRSAWDDFLNVNPATDSKTTAIKALVEMQTTGIEISYFNADICNINNIRQIAETIKRTHGKINGFIHCAGSVSDDFLVNKSIHQMDEVLSAKVNGTFNLVDIAEEFDIGFVFLFSSISSYIAPPGKIDYSAANSFMDHFALSHSHDQSRVISVNWPAWNGIGMMDRMKESKDKELAAQGSVSMSEGLEIFENSLQLPYCQVVVSREPLDQFKLLSNSIPSADKKSTVELDVETPDSESSFKDIVARTWIDETGVDAIDPDSNFFELGGSSLMATRVLSQLRSLLSIDLDATSIFKYPTLSDFTEHVESEMEQSKNNHVEIHADMAEFAFEEGTL